MKYTEEEIDGLVQAAINVADAYASAIEGSVLRALCLEAEHFRPKKARVKKNAYFTGIKNGVCSYTDGVELTDPVRRRLAPDAGVDRNDVSSYLPHMDAEVNAIMRLIAEAAPEIESNEVVK